MKEYLINGNCLKRGVNGELYVVKPEVAPFKMRNRKVNTKIKLF